MNNRQIPSTTRRFTNLATIFFSHSTAHRFFSFSFSPFPSAPLFLSLFLSRFFPRSFFIGLSIASRSRADRSSRERRTSFISSLVNETIYQRLCQNKNCYKTLASHERFCIAARSARVYTDRGHVINLFTSRASVRFQRGWR